VPDARSGQTGADPVATARPLTAVSAIGSNAGLPAVDIVRLQIPAVGAEPARDSFAWTVLSALAGEVDSRVDAQLRVSIDLVKRRTAVVGP
jgi:hypothetical protein